MDRDLLTSHKMLLSACEALAQAMGNIVDSLPAAGSARHAVERAQRNLDQARALTPDAEPTNAPQQDHEGLDPASFRIEPTPPTKGFIPAGVRALGS